ncbi:hypothetical protein ABW19_dt0202566 [Dactylella cylindrospora]|nr:hypothetical protein ABW19_dt0202566 [Dactylella cylindrospora]
MKGLLIIFYAASQLVSTGVLALPTHWETGTKAHALQSHKRTGPETGLLGSEPSRFPRLVDWQHFSQGGVSDQSLHAEDTDSLGSELVSNSKALMSKSIPRRDLHEEIDRKAKNNLFRRKFSMTKIVNKMTDRREQREAERLNRAQGAAASSRGNDSPGTRSQRSASISGARNSGESAQPRTSTQSGAAPEDSEADPLNAQLLSYMETQDGIEDVLRRLIRNDLVERRREGAGRYLREHEERERIYQESRRNPQSLDPDNESIASASTIAPSTWSENTITEFDEILRRMQQRREVHPIRAFFDNLPEHLIAARRRVTRRIFPSLYHNRNTDIQPPPGIQTADVVFNPSEDTPVAFITTDSNGRRTEISGADLLRPQMRNAQGSSRSVNQGE